MRTSGMKDYENFISFLVVFFVGAGVVLSYVVTKKPQLVLVDLAIAGFITYGVVGLFFLLRSLKRPEF